MTSNTIKIKLKTKRVFSIFFTYRL